MHMRIERGQLHRSSIMRTGVGVTSLSSRGAAVEMSQRKLNAGLRNEYSLTHRRRCGNYEGFEAYLILDQKLHTLDGSSSSLRYCGGYTTHCVETLVNILISLSADSTGERDLA